MPLPPPELAPSFLGEQGMERICSRRGAPDALRDHRQPTTAIVAVAVGALAIHPAVRVRRGLADLEEDLCQFSRVRYPLHLGFEAR